MKRKIRSDFGGARLAVAVAALAVTFGLYAGFGQATDTAVGLIQLQAPLDEPEFYCVDVPGFGANVQLDNALSAHTCKPGADDEVFSLNAPEAGQITIVAYGLCVEAEGAEAGAAVFLQACLQGEPMQGFVYTDAGQIQLAEAGSQTLCLAVAPGSGEPTGGPSHLRRDLALEACSDVDPALSRWKIGVTNPS